MQTDVARRITIEATQRGVAEATAGLNKLAAAGGNVAQISEKQEKASLSVERALEKQQRALDLAYRSSKQFEQAQRDLDRGLHSGLINQARHTQLLDLASKQYLQTAGSQRLMAQATQDLQNRAQGLAASLGPVGALLTSLGPAGLAAAATFGLAAIGIKQAADASLQLAERAGKLKDFAETTGFSVTQLQALEKAGAQVGVSSESVNRALERFSVQMDDVKDSTGQLYESLYKVDPALAGQVARANSLTEAWDLVAQAVRKADLEQANMIARQAFGRGGIEVTRLQRVNADAGGVKGLISDMRAVDQITAAQADKWDTLGDKIAENMKIAKQNITATFAEPVLNTMNEFSEAMLNLSRTAKDFKISDELRYLLYGAGTVAGFLLGGPLGAAAVGATAIAAELERQRRLSVPQITVTPAPQAAAAQVATKALEDQRQETIRAANEMKRWMAVLGEAATPAEKLKMALLDLDAAVAKLNGTNSADVRNRKAAHLVLESEIALGGQRLSILGTMATAQDVAAQSERQLQAAIARGTELTEAEITAIRARNAELAKSSTLMNALEFDRAQQFRSPGEQRVAGFLRQNGLTEETGKMEASFLRATENMVNMRDATLDFAQGLLQSTRHAKSLADLLGQVSLRWMDQAASKNLTAIINGQFAGGSSGGATGFNFAPIAAGLGSMFKDITDSFKTFFSPNGAASDAMNAMAFSGNLSDMDIIWPDGSFTPRFTGETAGQSNPSLPQITVTPAVIERSVSRGVQTGIISVANDNAAGGQSDAGGASSSGGSNSAMTGGLGLAAIGLGSYSAGKASANPGMGALSGALSGGLAMAATGNPMMMAAGAIVGGVAGFLGGNAGVNQKNQEAQEARDQRWSQVAPQADIMIKTLNHPLGQFGSSLTQARLQAQQMANEAGQGGDMVANASLWRELHIFMREGQEAFRETLPELFDSMRASFGPSGAAVTAAANIREAGKSWEAFVNDVAASFETENLWTTVHPDDLARQTQMVAEAQNAAQVMLLSALQVQQPLSAVATELERIRGTAAGLERPLKELGMTADEVAQKIAAGVTAALAKLGQSFDESITARTNAVSGRGYLNDFRSLQQTGASDLNDAERLLRDAGPVHNLIRLQAQKIVDDAQLGSAAIAEILSLFPEFTGFIHEFVEVIKRSETEIARERQALQDQVFVLLQDRNTLTGQLAVNERERQRAVEEQARVGGENLVDLELLYATKRYLITKEFADKEVAALTEAKTYISGIARQITEWANAKLAGPQSPLSPLARVNEADTQFATQRALAQGGNRDALNTITQYADAVIEAYRNAYASSTTFQNRFDAVLSQVRALPAQVAPEQLIVNAIAQQTTDINAQQELIRAQAALIAAFTNSTSGFGSTTATNTTQVAAIKAASDVTNTHLAAVLVSLNIGNQIANDRSQLFNIQASTLQMTNQNNTVISHLQNISTQVTRSANNSAAQNQNWGTRAAAAIATFATGGYTGNAGVNQATGIVHGQEYVSNAETVRRLGIGFFDKLAQGHTPALPIAMPGNDNGSVVHAIDRLHVGLLRRLDKLERVLADATLEGAEHVGNRVDGVNQAVRERAREAKLLAA